MLMTKTEKFLRVTMPDGSQYNVPARIIAEDRAKYYAENYTGQNETREDVFEQEKLVALRDDYILIDWAADNMNWEDVEAHAVKVDNPQRMDFEEAWLSADKEVITKEVEAND